MLILGNPFALRSIVVILGLLQGLFAANHVSATIFSKLYNHSVIIHPQTPSKLYNVSALNHLNGQFAPPALAPTVAPNVGQFEQQQSSTSVLINPPPPSTTPSTSDDSTPSVTTTTPNIAAVTPTAPVPTQLVPTRKPVNTENVLVRVVPSTIVPNETPVPTIPKTVAPTIPKTVAPTIPETVAPTPRPPNASPSQQPTTHSALDHSQKSPRLHSALNHSKPLYRVSVFNHFSPIITSYMFWNATDPEGEGRNINGPSMIRIPDWIPPNKRAHPSAVYYLYFAHHRGLYIRMAWASHITGPYTLFNVGRVQRPGVLSMNLNNKRKHIGNGIILNKHIASPDVHVDHNEQRIIMYFHAPIVGVHKQYSFVATSKTGLDFNKKIEPVILTESYLRTFEYMGELYGVANGGDIYKARSLQYPWAVPPGGFNYNDQLWERGTNPFANQFNVRHPAVRLIGDQLEIFYSRRFDAPERILMSTIDLRRGNFKTWVTSMPPIEIRRPLLDWEGAHYPVEPSERGKKHCCVNQLRDPYVFDDEDGKSYLLYSAQGENSLALALLSRA